MISHRCQRCSLPSDDAVCSHCGFRRCKYNSKDVEGDGDKGYHWKCARCHASTPENPGDDSRDLLTIMSALSEKFEVVNKIQLPKLNGELAHIKHVSENIAKQNTEILRKLLDAEKRNNKKRDVDVHGYRKRNLNLPVLGQWTLTNKRVKPSMSFECTDHTPIMPTEKTIRYRSRIRRRSYTFLLSKMVQALNSRLHRSNMSPRMRRRR